MVVDTSLASKQCSACQSGIPPLSGKEAGDFLSKVPGWTLNKDATRLQRTFRFDDFAAALAFAMRVGELCEKEGHHADIAFGWGYCSVDFHTRKIGGLHQNDFIMAAKVNAIPLNE